VSRRTRLSCTRSSASTAALELRASSARPPRAPAPQSAGSSRGRRGADHLRNGSGAPFLFTPGATLSGVAGRPGGGQRPAAALAVSRRPLPGFTSPVYVDASGRRILRVPASITALVWGFANLVPLRRASDLADEVGMAKRSIRNLVHKKRAEKKELSPEMHKLMASNFASQYGLRDPQDESRSSSQESQGSARR
jgi:hypothetical protein